MVEGALKIVGVKWKICDSVVGFHNFITNTIKKNAKGKQKLKRSPVDNLKFVVVKVRINFTVEFIFYLGFAIYEKGVLVHVFAPICLI